MIKIFRLLAGDARLPSGPLIYFPTYSSPVLAYKYVRLAGDPTVPRREENKTDGVVLFKTMFGDQLL